MSSSRSLIEKYILSDETVTDLRKRLGVKEPTHRHVLQLIDVRITPVKLSNSNVKELPSDDRYHLLRRGLRRKLII